MKKLLLSMALMAGATCLANAASYTITTNGTVLTWTYDSDETKATATVEAGGETFKLTYEKAESSTALSQGLASNLDHIRIYKGTKFTIESAIDMKTVVFNTTNASYAEVSNEYTPSGWTATGNGTAKTITVTNQNGNNSLTMSCTGGQVRVSSIVISDEAGAVDPTPDPTPNPNPSDGSLWSSLLEDSATCDWTFDNVAMPEELTYIWNWKAYNNKYYLNASAYADGTAYVSEAYAISPALTITGGTKVSMSFDHAAKFQTTLRTLCCVVVREKGATTWTALTIPTWPEAGSWTFANSGDIDLSAYIGKTIEIAFKYASTADGADTWEVKNVKLTGDATVTAEGGSTPDPNPNPNPNPGDFATGSESAPLSVAEFLAQGTPTAAVADTWVKGYIVGYVPGQSISGAVFSATGEEVSATNLLIAASASETDVNNCIPVQLPAGDIRTALNLQANPDNLGKEVTLCGSHEKYFGVNGLKSVKSYKLGDGGGSTPDPTPTPDAVEVKSVAEMKALATDTPVKVMCKLTVAYVYNSNIFCVDEAGDAIQVYSANTYESNSVIPTGWEAKYSLYGGTTPELVPSGSLPESTMKGNFTPRQITDGVVTVDMVNEVVEVMDVTFDAATPDAKENFEGVSAGKTLSFRNNYTIAGVPAGLYNVTVVVTIYQNEPSLYVTKYSATSGVSTIDAENAEAVYYDINGRVVKGNLDKGLYIRVVNGNATKVLVK